MTNDSVLVYHHRAESSPAIENGLAIISAAELATVLRERADDLQATRMPLPRGATAVEIYECDLLTEAQKVQHAGLPNYKANVAGVKVPLGAVLGHLVDKDRLAELVILSAKR